MTSIRETYRLAGELGLALDAALRVGSPAGLPVAEEGWECAADSEGVSYCSTDPYFRRICQLLPPKAFIAPMIN